MIDEAAFAAGCFWGVEDGFMQIEGVTETEVGFMGGHTKNAGYDDVSGGNTGHAETVHLKYDPGKVSYVDLLEAFWGMHNPITPNRQGPDVGSQYRSIIFYYTKEQRDLAEKSKKEQQKKYGDKKVVTEIVPAGEFWMADDHHQKYHQKHGKEC